MSYAKSVTHWLALASFFGGVTLGGMASTGAASASAIQVSEKKGASDTPPARPLQGRGQELYQASCVVCHGPRAEGGVGPKLAGNPVLSNDREFWKIVHEGRHVMPPLKGTVTDQHLNDIRAWLRTLP